jgi:16S rRNA (guanine(966)-N(2))-methyltransferase RsmD
MRILTGELKGRLIPFKPEPKLRATSDKVREALVNILKAKIDGSEVLDLFSGTGAVGFEMLSNGAKQAVFVEHHNKHFAQLHASIKHFGFGDNRARVLGLDVYKALLGMDQKFDIIFADPPYEEDHQEKLLASITRNCLLKDGGLLVLELHKKKPRITSNPDFELLAQKVYGDTQVLIFNQVPT